MSRSPKEPFEEKKIYYSLNNHFKLRYEGKNLEGFYCFKVLAHSDPVYDWEEYKVRAEHLEDIVEKL